MSLADNVLELIRPQNGADQIVPPTGTSAWLVTAASAAMAFLAVFAMALSMATGRMADRWSSELARTATLRVSAPVAQLDAQVARAMSVLQTTPGVEQAIELTDDDQQALLEPWFGPDLPLDSLPIPRLIEIVEADEGFDADALRLRLQAEVPGAVLDDHSRWRQPLVSAASALRWVSYLAVALITVTVGVIVTLAANAALAANAQIIRVLRLIGAKDAYIAKAFVRRFTMRTLAGGLAGVAVGLLVLLVMPDGDETGFLTRIAPEGWQWLWPFVIAPISAMVAFFATRATAFRVLRGMS